MHNAIVTGLLLALVSWAPGIALASQDTVRVSPELSAPGSEKSKAVKPKPKKAKAAKAVKSKPAKKPAAVKVSSTLAPGGRLPGGIDDSLKAAPALPAPKVEDRRKKTAPPSDGQMRTTIKRFEFEGNTLFSSEELSALIQDYLDRPLTLAEIYEAGDKVSDHYVLAGYSLAVVTVPAQKIAGGRIKFRVLEGVVGRISTEDNQLYSTQSILSYLGDTQAGQVYRARPLEESLQALNSLPGLQTKAVIKPGEDPGASDLIIKVQEKPFAASLGFDNFGRSNTGALRGTFAGVVNNPFGLADQMQFVTLRSGTGRLEYYSGAYNLKPFVRGPRLALSYGTATFNVAGATGTSRNGRGSLDFSLLNTRANKFNLGLGATRIVSSVNLAGVPQPVTSITAYDFSASYNRVDELAGVTAAVLSLATNFRGNSTADCTGAGNNACRNQAVKLDLAVQHLQPIAPRFDSLIRLNAAYSPQPLPDNQQFSAGGPSNVRAFRSAEIRGDQGFVTSVDLRYGVPLGPVSATVRLFGDYAQVGTVDSGARGTQAFDAIADYGLGLDLGYTEHLALKVDVARPIATGFTAADGVRADTRAYASVTLSY